MIAELLVCFLDNLNFWTIFLLMAVESSFVPFPSEVVVPPAAYRVAQGNLYATEVFLAAILGSLFGALLNYILAYFLGRPLVYAFARSRVGRFFLLSEEKIAKSERYFDKKGAVSTFIGRLIPGIRQLISIPAGLAKMKMGPFLFYTFLGATIWNGVLFGLGYWAASLPEVDSTDKLINLVSHYSHWIGYSILIVVLLVVVSKVIRYFSKKKQPQ